MLRFRKRWCIGALVVLALVPLVLLAVWGCMWRKPLPHLTYEQCKSLSKQGVPRAEVERLLGPPVRLGRSPEGQTEYIYEAKREDDDRRLKGSWEDMFILHVVYDDAGAVSYIQVSGDHQYTPLGRLLNDLFHE